MKIKIKVTKEDIKLGDQSNPCDCPVARAIKRTIDCEAYDVFVDSLSVEISIKFNGLRKFVKIRLPKEAIIFVHRFDVSDFVKPFAFELDV